MYDGPEYIIENQIDIIWNVTTKNHRAYISLLQTRKGTAEYAVVCLHRGKLDEIKFCASYTEAVDYANVWIDEQYKGGQQS
ncbi:MAG: hypothetical protein AB1652_09725 [Bacillota bacterium]